MVYACPESDYAPEIYKFARMAIEPKVSRYEVPRGEDTPVIHTSSLIIHYFEWMLCAAGLGLLAKHAAQFREYLVKDYEVNCPHSYQSLDATDTASLCVALV